jgi:hypothetical protein
LSNLTYAAAGTVLIHQISLGMAPATSKHAGGHAWQHMRPTVASSHWALAMVLAVVYSVRSLTLDLVH